MVITVDAASPHLPASCLHWKGGLISEISVDLPKPRPPYRPGPARTRSLDHGRAGGPHYDDSMIAKVLNQQQRRTATGMSFTPVNVASIRKRHGISPYQGGDAPDPDGEVMSVHQAAAELGITASTLYRWLNDGFVPAEQITPGAPWRIRLTQSIRELVTDDAPAGWVRPGRHRHPQHIPGRPCCSVSSAATSAPPTSAPDAGKASVSSYPPPDGLFFSHPRTVKELEHPGFHAHLVLCDAASPGGSAVMRLPDPVPGPGFV